MNPKNQTYMSICIAVIHHIATAERRVHALRELSRVLRVSQRELSRLSQFSEQKLRFFSKVKI